ESFRLRWLFACSAASPKHQPFARDHRNRCGSVVSFLPCCHSKGSGVEAATQRTKSAQPRCQSREVAEINVTGCLDFDRHDTDCSPADCNHFAIWLVIISKLVFPWFSVDHIDKELPELFVTRAGPQ